MKRIAILASVLSAALVFVVPFVGGGGPGLTPQAVADSGSATPLLASMSTVPVTAAVAAEAPRVALASTVRISEDAFIAQAAAEQAAAKVDWEHTAQKPVPKPVPVVNEDGSFNPDGRRSQLAAQGLTCPGDAGGSVPGAPSAYSALGVAGTTSDDLASFAYQYNAIRIENCLDPVPYGNFYYDSCMEARLFWMAESPSPDPLDAWGHMGSTRIDGVPSTGCDGNLAGGSGNSGATVASKWWNSGAHRASLYRPGADVGGACIAFAMTHGGIDEPYSFTRSAARWTNC